MVKNKFAAFGGDFSLKRGLKNSPLRGGFSLKKIGEVCPKKIIFLIFSDVFGTFRRF